MTAPSIDTLAELIHSMVRDDHSADAIAGWIVDLYPPHPDTLAEVLHHAQTGAPEVCVESAVMAYQSAQTAIDRYELVKTAAKKLIGEVMEEVGRTKFVTRAGTAQVTSPSTTISYDGKALDVLCTADADLALKLFPYRKEVQRAGSLRIAGAK